MKRVFTIYLICFVWLSLLQVHAQDVKLDMLISAGGMNADAIEAMAVDEEGNIYISGSFAGTLVLVNLAWSAREITMPSLQNLIQQGNYFGQGEQVVSGMMLVMD